MLIDARENVINSMVEGVKAITRADFNFNGYTLEDVLANTAKEASLIYDILFEHGIEFEIVEKQGWGKVFKFNYKGRELFTHTYSKKKNKLELYFWSEEYSCKYCGYKLSRVDREAVLKEITKPRGTFVKPKGSYVGDGTIRDLAEQFNCYLDAMYAIVVELGFKVFGSATDYMRYL